MGTTFVNLHIKAKGEEIPESMIPKEYICVQTAEDWTSVFEAEGSFAWGKLCNLGKKISKRLEVPVIAVSYFDDDEFSMNLIMAGKSVASYRAAISRNTCSGSTKWIDGLALTKEEASAFRYLVKKEMTAGESIAVFSCLIGVQMYSDVRMYEESDKLWRKDSERIIREIEEEKKKNRVKNRTKAKFLMEIPGLFESYDERTGVLRMVYPDGKGDFLYHHVHCMKIGEEGLREIYDFRYPSAVFGENSRHLWMDYEHKEIQVMNKEGFYNLYDLQTYEKVLEALMEVPKEKITDDENEFVDITPVYTEHAIDAGRYEYLNSPEDSNTLKKVDIETSGKTYAEKKVIAFYRYEKPDCRYGLCICRRPIITKDGIVNVCIIYVNQPQKTIYDIRFFDKEINLLRKEEICLEDRYLSQITYCEANDCIYVGNKKVNLKNHQVEEGGKELRDANCLFIHYSSKNAGFLYAIKGSYVYVYDLDMKLLSCHRLKGRIMYFYHGKDGNVRLITVGDIVCDMGRPDKNSAVRVYRIEDL